MKKVMSIAAIALMMAGSYAYACGGCGCVDKKSDEAADDGKKAEKTSCSGCSASKKA